MNAGAQSREDTQQQRELGWQDSCREQHAEVPYWTNQVCPSISVGFVLLAVSLLLEWWNETHLNSSASALLAAERAYVEVPCQTNDSYEGMLVHATCYLSGLTAFPAPPGLANQPESALTGIRLLRKVEVYQWHEKLQTKTIRDPIKGNRIIQTFTYRLQWSSTYKDASTFAKPTTCRFNFNHGYPCVNIDPSTQDWWQWGPQKLGMAELGRASHLRFGSFSMPEEFVNTVGTGEFLEPSCDGSFNSTHAVSDFCSPFVRIVGDYVYYKNLINRTEELREDNTGDIRVQYMVTKSKEASVLARQACDESGNRTFTPWKVPGETSGGGNSSEHVYLIENGIHTAEGMLRNYISQSFKQIWFIRCITFAFTFLSIFLILSPVFPQQTDEIVAASPESVHVKIRGESAAGVSALLAAAVWFTVIGGAWMHISQGIGTVLLLISVCSCVAAIVTNWSVICTQTLDPRREPLLEDLGENQEGITLGADSNARDQDESL